MDDGESGGGDEAEDLNNMTCTLDSKTLKKINALIKDIQRDTFSGLGKPEPLKLNLSGWWSRRIGDDISCQTEI